MARSTSAPRASGRRAKASLARHESHAQATAIGIDLTALAVFERMFLRMPVRLLRARNNALDQLFYDVDAIPAIWRRRLLRWSDPSGSVVVVHPGNGRDRDIEHFEHIEKFVASLARRSVATVALAGVGSSALGTAALAANAADAIGKPVAGIVSGYGLADVLVEGLLGWFVLRPYNRLRQLVDAYLRFADPIVHAISATTQPNGDPSRLVSYVRGLPDADALEALLALPRPFVATIVGHSKGNLCIAAALGNLSGAQWRDVCPRLSVVTLGALVELPANVGATRQFIGALDGFGLVNSVLPQVSIAVPWATHTLNTRWPFHLAASQAIADAENGPSSPLERGWRAMAQACAPVSLASCWIDACAGSAIAFDGAIGESLRSLRQGTQHAAARTRAALH